MATIVIRDLPENMALDREAMRAISGGARVGGRTPGGRATPRTVFRPAAVGQAPRRAAPTLLFP
ncbi:hypothetical protein [Aromatoleum buckelii]|uniref:Uncharacterized protein n=1 Tax=Aromatoleum buckelii TaxID=200254 RepID=A0ABX1N4C2_9RHOO|nr:hypothetical protein [Aromatoleum buckelii]MCK0511859.1 hypothetical protein [Aromatoleum buckelii]